jgi:uncharacterized protein YraI
LIAESFSMEASMLKLWPFLVSATFVLAAPAAALAARGEATTNVNMRAGPGTEYPAVSLIPADARIDIHGCLKDGAWCDVSWRGNRGWVDARYLDYFRGGHYVYLPDYVNIIDVPLVTFSLGDYWNDYYVGEPWYGRLGYWQGFWRSHGRYGHEGGGHGRFVREQGAPGPGQHAANAAANPGPLGGKERRHELVRSDQRPAVGVRGGFHPSVVGHVRPGQTQFGARAGTTHFAGHFGASHFGAPHVLSGFSASHVAGITPHAFASVGHGPIGGAPHVGGGIAHVGGGGFHGAAGGHGRR